ncbi:MAG TPA: hypothetical protein VEG25_04210 [Burkholderiales bacterium]|nr:hypothetical protein [Burkholderiales bacterium]
MLFSRRTVVITTLFVTLLPGCGTTMVVTPEVKPTFNNDFRMKGQIVYDGNRDYFPRTIAEDSLDKSGLVFRYKYEVAYGKDNLPQAIPLFNPLTLVGFPVGEDTVVIVGHMEILRENGVVKTYTATCAFDKKRSMYWEGDTLTELRKKGLIAVRDNIETQMNQDQVFLSKLITDK